MKFREMGFGNSYINQGSDSLVDAFLNPALKVTKEYKRSAGFFSSDGLIPIMDGLLAMARNGGHVKLIVSPRLNEEDIQAITAGYEQRQERVLNAFTRDFVEEIEKLPDVKLQFLYDLIKTGVLDIKIAVLKNKDHGLGIYHDKLGILHDFEGDTVVFYGSANASYGGYKGNYERVRIAKGWVEGFDSVVTEEEAEFDSLWDNTNPFLESYEYTEIAHKNIVEVIQKKAARAKGTGIKLRDYQEEAIKAWVANGYHGFYVMATGTGKTWTAIYSAKTLVEQHPSLIVICAPYKHLVRQWSEDVEKAFPGAKIIMVSSENQGWDDQIKTAIIKSRYGDNSQLVIISTISSFRMDRFGEAVGKYKGEKLLIVDEAHRFTDRPSELKDEYAYMLGLSATPFSGKSAAKGKELKLSRLKGKTGIKNWNVLCRWAFCFSLHEGTVPTDVPIVADSNVEMSWYTFTGEYSEIYESLMTAWCLEKEIEPTEENLSKYFKLHLERGIAYLSGTNFIKSIDDLLDLALKENQ